MAANLCPPLSVRDPILAFPKNSSPKKYWIPGAGRAHSWTFTVISNFGIYAYSAGVEPNINFTNSKLIEIAGGRILARYCNNGYYGILEWMPDLYM